jgi:hypothetical protein
MTDFKEFVRHYPWTIPTLLFALLVLLGSMMHPLWGDEAETALFARSILIHGIPYGWDGMNIMGISDAIVLDKHLINHTSPWAQYYIAAASFLILGESSFSARLPFILFSILSLPLMYLIVLKMTKDKLTATLTIVIMALSVPYILFGYQARYYSITGVMRILLLLSVLYLPIKHHWPKILFIFAGVVFFYANYLVFFCFFVSFFLSYLVYLRLQRKSWHNTFSFIKWFIILSIPITFLTLPWYIAMKPLGGNGQLALPSFSLQFFQDFWQIYLPTLVQYNYYNAFPVVLFFLLILVIAYKITKKEPIGNYIFPMIVPFLSLLIMSVLTAIPISVINFTATRYTFNVFPFFAFAVAMVITVLWRWKQWVGVTVLFILLFTNLFTLQPFRSYFFEYLSEIVNPYKTPDKEVADYLKIHAKSGDTAFVSLDRDHEPLIFHLKDKIRFVNRVSMTNQRIFPENREIIPRYIYAYTEEPDWVILYGKRGMDGTFLTFDYRQIPLWIDLDNNYTETVLPVFFADVSRPEIEWRSFTKISPVESDQVFVYKKKDK